jgi:hypothetical protein
MSEACRQDIQELLRKKGEKEGKRKGKKEWRQDHLTECACQISLEHHSTTPA